ncbi:MAG: bifunctional aspartate transaminase/aspartate 4-decarboxylase [Methanobacterium sp.]|uniref:bifunctional aspartate transaminase/aspartate 4-decarboxylase n=1 Tax=Methanobacterium sp. TaxID=2164 RepID=UPI003C73D01B
MDYKELKSYMELSPFEVQFELTNIAGNFRDHTLLNAGRGNPNWIATTPRLAFFTLGIFAIEEAKCNCEYIHTGFHPEKEGIAKRFQEFSINNPDMQGMKFLKDSVAYGIEKLGFEPDSWVYELVIGCLGDFYPEPDRILPHTEQIVQSFLGEYLCNKDEKICHNYDLFATEGGTGGIIYVFNSLMENKLIKHGDKIAIGSPIFSPYLEIPHLNDYNLEEVEIVADVNDEWQYPDSEIDKLKDPSIKAFFVVNPGNPQSRAIRDETVKRIADIVKNDNPNLIIITDDVYASFVEGFHSLMSVIPSNTICVYSFSKHMGCTGWRLGVVALAQDNRIDKMISSLPDSDKNKLIQRYQSIDLDPENMKFIDRLVADSRSVALKHTAGLSLPQQTQMTLFSLFFIIEDNISYINGTKKALNGRIHILYKTLGLPLDYDKTATNYYAIIDLLEIARDKYSTQFADWMVEKYNALAFVFALADKESVVLLPGAGFDASSWSVRISLANLRYEAYEEIGIKMLETLETAFEDYQISTKK